jgi:hypothetical protein
LRLFSTLLIDLLCRKKVLLGRSDGKKHANFVAYDVDGSTPSMKGKPHRPWTIARNVFYGLLAICCVMVVIGAFIPMSEPRIPLNHMRTAYWVLKLIAAERQYSERFPAVGFTCDLHQLEQAGIVDKVLASE